jgi:hypothetical protein
MTGGFYNFLIFFKNSDITSDGLQKLRYLYPKNRMRGMGFEPKNSTRLNEIECKNIDKLMIPKNYCNNCHYQSKINNNSITALSGKSTTRSASL